MWDILEKSRDNTLTARSFYGVIHIENASRSGGPTRRMVHGQTCHGTQFIDRDKRHLPTTYYGWDSGVGLAISQFRQQREQGLRIGVVGLGTGTISAMAERGDLLRYYEINRDVDRIARKYFTYLSDTKADVDVVFGDARLLLEREAERGMKQNFDVLVIDAFDGDAIPLHLLTREAFDVYWSHLKPDGLLAVHVSNRYVDLTPVVRGLAMLADHRAFQIVSTQHERLDIDGARWMLVTSNRKFLASKAVEVAATPWSERDEKPFVWTDDSANLWSVAGSPGTQGKWESAPNRGRFVVDDANLIEEEDKDRIQRVCRRLYHDTDGVNPIMVVTVKSMASTEAGDISFETFRAQLYRRTRMFKPKGDNGAMILISVGDRRFIWGAIGHETCDRMSHGSARRRLLPASLPTRLPSAF